jgi:hypothetical protein
MKCPICRGKGGWHEDMGEGTILYDPCRECNETGRVSWLYIINLWFWQTIGDQFIRKEQK